VISVLEDGLYAQLAGRSLIVDVEGVYLIGNRWGFGANLSGISFERYKDSRIATPILFAQIARERYGLLVVRTVAILAGIVALFFVLGLIFKWVGADIGD